MSCKYLVPRLVPPPIDKFSCQAINLNHSCARTNKAELSHHAGSWSILHWTTCSICVQGRSIVLQMGPKETQPWAAWRRSGQVERVHNPRSPSDCPMPVPDEPHLCEQAEDQSGGEG